MADGENSGREGEQKFNEEDVRKFYRFLQHKNETEIRLIRPPWDKSINEDEKAKEQKSFFVHGEDEFVNVIKQFNGKRNIYVGVNERKRGGRYDDDVEYITKIPHDIDAHSGRPEDLVKAQDVALKIKDDAIKQGYKETLVILSGNGFWDMHTIKPIPNTPENVAKIKQFGKNLKAKYEIEGIEVDTSVYNPSRIVRVPGTLNISKEDNQVLSFIVNEPEFVEDEKLTEDILNIEIPETENIDTGTAVEILERNLINESHPWLHKMIKDKIEIGQGHRNDVVLKYTAMICVMERLTDTETKTIAEAVFSNSCKDSNYAEFRGWINQVKDKKKDYSNYKNHINKFIKDNGYLLTAYDLDEDDKEENREYYREKGLEKIWNKISKMSLEDPVQKSKDKDSIFDDMHEANLDKLLEDDILKEISKKAKYPLSKMREMYVKRKKPVPVAISENKIIDETDGINPSFDKAINIFSDKKELARHFIKIQPVYFERKGQFWVWDFARYCWVEKDETDILNSISKHSNVDTVSSKDRIEILEALKQVGRENKPQEIKPTWVQFKDKIYDIETDEIHEATPKYFVANPIDWKVGDSEETPMIDELIKSWVGEKDAIKLYEIIAFVPVPKYFIHSFFFLFSPPGMGKSTFVNLLIKFIGKHNHTSTSIDRINYNSRFETYSWNKKLLITMSEVSSADELKNSSLINKATGEDSVKAEIKGGTSFEFFNYGKFVYPTNKLLKIDREDGFGRRVRTHSFVRRFEKEKDVLEDIPEWEFENLAKKCLRIAKGLWEKRQFTGDGSISERMDNYQTMSKTPLERFMDECCDLTEFDAKIQFDEFYATFCNFLKNSKDTISKVMLSKNLKKLGFEARNSSWETTQQTLNGSETKWESKSTLFGIKWKESKIS